MAADYLNIVLRGWITGLDHDQYFILRQVHKHLFINFGVSNTFLKIPLFKISKIFTKFIICSLSFDVLRQLHRPICVFDDVVPPPSELTMSGVAVSPEMTPTDHQVRPDKHWQIESWQTKVYWWRGWYRFFSFFTEIRIMQCTWLSSVSKYILHFNAQ